MNMIANIERNLHAINFFGYLDFTAFKNNLVGKKFRAYSVVISPAI